MRIRIEQCVLRSPVLTSWPVCSLPDISHDKKRHPVLARGRALPDSTIITLITSTRPSGGREEWGDRDPPKLRQTHFRLAKQYRGSG